MHVSSTFTTCIGLRIKVPSTRLPLQPHKSASCGTSISGRPGSLTLQPVGLLASQADLTGSCYTSQPTEAFTSKLSMVWSPTPSLDITTAVTGQFCRWVSHPLEQRLALLHELPDVISENLSLDAGSPTPAVHRVLLPVSSPVSSAFPPQRWGRLPAFSPRITTPRGKCFEAADIS